MEHRFSTDSQQVLATVHEDLRRVAYRVLELHDCTAIEGARTLEQQQAHYRAGRSKLDGILKRSKHQVSDEQPLAIALDLAPYYAGEGIPWTLTEHNRLRWHTFAGLVLGVAHDMGVALRWGGDWDMDFTFTDQTFHDWPHYELVHNPYTS